MATENFLCRAVFVSMTAWPLRRTTLPSRSNVSRRSRGLARPTTHIRPIRRVEMVDARTIRCYTDPASFLPVYLSPGNDAR